MLESVRFLRDRDFEVYEVAERLDLLVRGELRIVGQFENGLVAVCVTSRVLDLRDVEVLPVLGLLEENLERGRPELAAFLVGSEESLQVGNVGEEAGQVGIVRIGDSEPVRPLAHDLEFALVVLDTSGEQELDGGHGVLRLAADVGREACHEVGNHRRRHVLVGRELGILDSSERGCIVSHNLDSFVCLVCLACL